MAKNRGTLSTQFKQFMRRETGLTINIHLMRHIAANNWLAAYPEDYETPRRLLGHRTAETTRKSYAHVDQRRAHRAYQETVAKARQAPSDAGKRNFDFGRAKRRPAND